jgi:protein-tyrosine-phosphatase
MADTPTVLFFCVHNSGLGLAARALLDHYAQGRIMVESAGSEPGDQLNPSVLAILSERGLDASRELPKPITDETALAADVITAMGCGDTCSSIRESGIWTESWMTLRASRLKQTVQSSMRSTAECERFSQSLSPLTRKRR